MPVVVANPLGFSSTQDHSNWNKIPQITVDFSLRYVQITRLVTHLICVAGFFVGEISYI